MTALGKAITTETRRIKKVVVAKQQEIETALSLPKQRINIQDKIRIIYGKLNEIFTSREDKLGFTNLIESSGEDRVSAFVSLLHLDNQHKVWLEQDGHFEEIWILLKHMYEKQNAPELERMRKEAEEEMKNFEDSHENIQSESAEENEED